MLNCRRNIYEYICVTVSFVLPFQPLNCWLYHFSLFLQIPHDVLACHFNYFIIYASELQQLRAYNMLALWFMLLATNDFYLCTFILPPRNVKVVKESWKLITKLLVLNNGIFCRESDVKDPPSSAGDEVGLVFDLESDFHVAIRRSGVASPPYKYNRTYLLAANQPMSTGVV